VIDDSRFDGELAAAGRGVRPVSACPSDAVLASFYAGELAASEEDTLRDHLAGCSGCVARARDAAAFAEAMKDEARLVPRARRFGPVPAWAAAMAAVFAVAAILIAWRVTTAPPPAPQELASAQPASPPVGPAERWRGLTIEAAPYAPGDGSGIVWRGGDESAGRPAEGSFAWAMEPYASGDFAGAAQRLDRRLHGDPRDDRARYYLGVALLLAGRPAESLQPLREVAEGNGDAAADASWYLTAACLKTGDEARAAVLLRELASKPGPHSARARELLGELEAVPER
jgi:TolA-binding protein